MSRFERKFGKYAIQNLSLVLIICYAIGYVIQLIYPNLINWLTLNPYAILHGQVWRLVSWILIPPQQSNILFIMIMLFFYYSIGTTLERTWGTYRYNVFLFSGMLFTIIGSFLAMGFAYLFAGDYIRILGAESCFQLGSLMISTYYVNMSIFLAYAATYPNNTVLLMMVIPIKVKWLGIVYGVMLVWDFIGGAGVGFLNIFFRFGLAASLLNFVVFFFTSRSHLHLTPKQMKRRHDFKKMVHKGETERITKHKCAICGRTDEDFPDLEFRFCSKCDGNYEYCQDHLFTHEHVKRH